VADDGEAARGPAEAGPGASSLVRPYAEGRKRRPTGAPPPLARSIGFSGKAWLALVVCLVIATVIGLKFAPRVIEHLDTAALRLLADARVGWLTDLARWINSAGSGWGVTVVGVTTVVLVMVFRRWRHLLVWLGSLAVLTVVGLVLLEVIPRPRPYGVSIIAGWGGFSTLSPPVAALTATLVGIAFTMAVPGRVRWFAKLSTVALVALLGLARLYLALDHPSDVLLGAALGVAIPVTMFRSFTPNEIFPVTYRGGNRAHLDVGGLRGAAIRRAVHDQLGLWASLTARMAPKPPASVGFLRPAGRGLQCDCERDAEDHSRAGYNRADRAAGRGFGQTPFLQLRRDARSPTRRRADHGDHAVLRRRGALPLGEVRTGLASAVHVGGHRPRGTACVNLREGATA
jgi:membrane-associated phospholipid phosphatase